MNPRHQKKIFSLCLAFSLCFHVGFLAFLQKQSLLFCSKIHTKTAKLSTPWHCLLDISFFEESTITSQSATQSKMGKSSLPEKETLQTVLSYEKSLPPAPKAPPITSPKQQVENFLTSLKTPNQNFSIPRPPITNLNQSIHQKLVLSSPPPTVPPTTTKPSSESKDSKLTAPTVTPVKPAQVQATANVFKTEPKLINAKSTPVLFSTLSFPNLPRIPTLVDLETVNLSDGFESDLIFAPAADGSGYIFALTLIPHPNINLPKIQQKITFLIDKSNSIQSDRLMAAKSALKKSLEELGPGDEFNIIAFDSKMEKLFTKLTPATPDALTKAEAFLNKIHLGNFFSPADLYKPLLQTIPAKIQEGETHSVILITDAESFSKNPARRAVLRDFTLQNLGKVSLYALAMESDHHLSFLDTACVFNKGNLCTSTTLRGLKRKLLKLTKNIQTPIAKNITTKAIAKSPNTLIEIFHDPLQAPHPYLDHPYTIFGSVDKPDDFVLFVQGRLKNNWLNIKKTISFMNAKKAGASLSSDVALQKAYQHYRNYIMTDNLESLTQANELTKTFHLTIVLE